MDIPVLVEKVTETRYVARSGEPFALCAEGVTSDEALNNLERAMRGQPIRRARHRKYRVRLQLSDRNLDPGRFHA